MKNFLIAMLVCILGCVDATAQMWGFPQFPTAGLNQQGIENARRAGAEAFQQALRQTQEQQNNARRAGAEAAAKMWRECEERQNNSSSSLCASARSLIINENYSEAARKLERAIELNNGGQPVFAQCCSLLGILYACDALGSENEYLAEYYWRKGGVASATNIGDKNTALRNVRNNLMQMEADKWRIINSVSNGSSFDFGSSSSGSSNRGTRSESCPQCYGTGQCQHCNRGIATSHYTGNSYSCSVCGGTGRCRTCHGTGRR